MIPTVLVGPHHFSVIEKVWKRFFFCCLCGLFMEIPPLPPISIHGVTPFVVKSGLRFPHRTLVLLHFDPRPTRSIEGAPDGDQSDDHQHPVADDDGYKSKKSNGKSNSNLRIFIDLTNIDFFGIIDGGGGIIMAQPDGAHYQPGNVEENYH